MSADFSFQVEPSRDLIRIRMGGFFTLADVDEFFAARHEAHQQLTCAANQHVTLNDIREMKIQSQGIVEAFRELLAAPDYRSRKLAFVVSPTLARTQLTRAINGRDAQCFEDMWRAEAWLFARQIRAA